MSPAAAERVVLTHLAADLPFLPDERLTDLLIAHLRETVAEMRAHEHPERGGDLFCLNLTSYLGERMGGVLRRLADEQAETRKWQEKHTALADEFTAEVDRMHAKLAAIDALHQPRTNSIGHDWCKACNVLYPCPTRRELDDAVQSEAVAR